MNKEEVDPFYIAICDDVGYYRQLIKRLVLKYYQEMGIDCIIDTYESGKLLCNLGLDVTKYKIVFLDINMEELDGISTAKQIRSISSELYIVFVTAYISYSLEGYKVNAERYILKENSNFENSLKECIDAITEKMNCQITKYQFPFMDGKKEIVLEQILYVESNLHKLDFIVMEDRIVKYSMYGKLDAIEKLLRQYNFIRIHQSYLANMKNIKMVHNYTVIFGSGKELPISKANFKAVKSAFIEYKGEV